MAKRNGNQTNASCYSNDNAKCKCKANAVRAEALQVPSFPLQADREQLWTKSNANPLPVYMLLLSRFDLS